MAARVENIDTSGWNNTGDGYLWDPSGSGIYYNLRTGVFGNSYLDEAANTQATQYLSPEEGMNSLIALEPELARLPTPTRESLRPSISEAVNNPLVPSNTLIIGHDEHYEPTWLPLYNPEMSEMGALSVMPSEASSGTKLLQIISASITAGYSPDSVQFGVLTNHPESWQRDANTPHCIGIYPMYDRASEDFLLSLASWAHDRKKMDKVIVLLADNLHDIHELDFDARQNFRWLLLRGPARNVLPIVTINPREDRNEIESWLDAFRTQLIGTGANTFSLNYQDVSYPPFYLPRLD